MAKMTCSGISAELERFQALARGADAAAEKAVKAGADLLAERLNAAAPVRTGALSKSVKAGKVSWSPGDGYHCTVAPTGTNHGEPLAKIGNILEYGRSNMPARPWFHPTVAQSEGEVTAAIAETFTAESAKKS